jgi:hypothetical protein
MLWPEKAEGAMAAVIALRSAEAARSIASASSSTSE